MEGETAEEMAEDVNFTPVQSGVTRWDSSGRKGADDPSSMANIGTETTFSVSLDLRHYKVGDVIAIYSLVRTDQGWLLGGEASSFPAQSNIVNARTNPQWSHIHANAKDGGSLIKGRLVSDICCLILRPFPTHRQPNDYVALELLQDWFSVPVTIQIGK